MRVETQQEEGLTVVLHLPHHELVLLGQEVPQLVDVDLQDGDCEATATSVLSFRDPWQCASLMSSEAKSFLCGDFNNVKNSRKFIRKS